MSEEQERVTKAYKRAGIGLAVVALLWIASLLFMGLPEDETTHWLIPIAAAALSVLCFSKSRYRER